MTFRTNNRIACAAAFIVLLGCLGWPAPSVYAEIRLHQSTATCFTLAFRTHAAADLLPSVSLQPPDTDETLMSSLLTIDHSLQQQQVRLAWLSPSQAFLRSLSGDATVRHEYHNPQTLSLQTARWNIPETSLEQVSTERPVPLLRQTRSALLTASYAATAFGGTCTVWDLTSSLCPESLSASPTSAGTLLASQLRDDFLLPAIRAYRRTPITVESGQLPETSVAPSSATLMTQSELQQPIQEGDAVRRWVLPPNVAAKFRPGGVQLISTQQDQPAPLLRQARLRPGNSGFRTP